MNAFAASFAWLVGSFWHMELQYSETDYTKKALSRQPGALGTQVVLSQTVHIFAQNTTHTLCTGNTHHIPICSSSLYTPALVH